jgi:hypothetical protein
VNLTVKVTVGDAIEKSRKRAARMRDDGSSGARDYA